MDCCCRSASRCCARPWARSRRRRILRPDAGGPPAPTGPHIYIRAGLKSHGPGQHDYPQFLADWSKIAHRARRGRRRLAALPERVRARRRRRDGDVQGRRRRHDAGGEDDARSLRQARRRPRQLPRHALRSRPGVLLDDSSAAPRSTARSTTRSRRRSLHGRRQGEPDHEGHRRTSRSRTRRSS